MGGGSHNSVAVEFKDYVAVIEAPLDQQRSLAVIAEVKKTFPNKPIRYVVNTHNHFDHLGGIRTYVAEGATVITEDKNREFYKNVVLAPQPRTLLPDRLSQRPFAPTGPGQLMLQTYTDSYTISDGNQTIELYTVEGLNHSDNMTIAYLPKAKLLVSADMGGPPPAGSPPPANISNNSIVLYNNIKRLKLDVVTHAPIHGPPGPQAEFDRIVGPAAARAPQQQGRRISRLSAGVSSALCPSLIEFHGRPCAGHALLAPAHSRSQPVANALIGVCPCFPDSEAGASIILATTRRQSRGSHHGGRPRRPARR